MPTMVFRVDKRVNEQTQEHLYVLSLHIDDGRNRDWAEQPVAADSIPAKLPAPAGPGLNIAAVQHALTADHVPGAMLRGAGGYLYDLLASSQVGTAWAQAVERFQHHQNGSGPLRTFFDVRPPELSALPWELMMRHNMTHPFLDDRHVCVRGSYRQAAELAEKVAAVPVPVPVPVRLLVAVGDPDDSALRAEDEVDAIYSGLRDHPGEWHVEVLWGPTQQQFSACFKAVRPHVFHFIGHSVMSAYDGMPTLEFQPGGGQTGWNLDDYQIMNTYREFAPQFVFLNSCRSSDHAYGDNERAQSREAALGVARAFQEIGTEAVLGMQADIPSEPAVRFSQAVYGLLADGSPVDVAVRDARKSLFNLEQEPVPRAWALPSLTVCGDPDRVLARQLALTREVARQLIRERFCEIGSMVDRTAEHRELWGGSDCGRLPAPAVLVTGAERVGKSALVKSCLFTWSLRGCRVAYVDLRPPRRTLDWLDILRQVRDSLVAFLPERAAEPARRFSHELAYRKEGLDPEPLPEAGGRTDDGRRWLPATEQEPELREATFASARAMLEETAGGEPMLLAIDHLAAGLSDAVRDKVVPRLLMPIAEGVVGQVSVAVVETTGKAEELLSPPFRARAAQVVVVPFPRSIHFYRQFAALTGRPYDGEWRRFSEILIDRGSAGMLPEEFQGLVALVKSGEVNR
jgi:CHAT domain-containing protein